MINRIVLYIAFLIATCSNGLFSQAPFFKNIVFDKEKKGAKLLKLFQDSKGYMWLGTSVGICRYDGTSFLYLGKDSNEVTAIGENMEGVLWIGHLNGLIEYKDNNTLIRFLPGGGLPSTKITDIIFDKKNRLWFSTYGAGVFCYDNNILYNVSIQDGLADNDVYDLLLVENENVWAATDRGISIVSISNGKKNTKPINSNNGLPDNIVRNLKLDGSGNVWIAMQDKGVCVFNRTTNKIEVPIELQGWNYGQVNDVQPMKREVFIGTEEYGIIEIHFGLKTLNRMKAAKNKKLNAVKQILLDRNEQVWVFADNLLNITNSNHFQLIEIPLQWQGALKAITTDNLGKIWYCNKAGLFVKPDNNNAIQKINLPFQIDFSSVVCIYADMNNNIWIGTYNNGLYQYIPKSNFYKRYSKINGLVDDNIFSISGVGNEIWLGTLGGATKMDISTTHPTFQNFTKQNGLSNNYVYNVFIDSKRNKWFATDGSGICMLNDTGFRNYEVITGLNKNIVYTITEDIFGTIWFTGLNAGLFSFDGKKFKAYGIQNGLHDNDISNLVADDKGNLVITHPDGIELFNVTKEYFTFYSTESGFENIKPELNAWCKTPKNAILIGGSDKIIQYNAPDTNYQLVPQIIMNGISLFFQPFDFKKKNKFAYDENHLTFDYTGLWYLNPEGINYQYLLEGYGNRWVTTKDHAITFPKLPPGKYLMKLRASGSENFDASTIISYCFTITKPFWLSWLFWLFTFICFSGIVYLVVKARVQQIRNKEQLIKERFQLQYDALKNQVNPHFLFNSFNALMNIVEENPKEASVLIKHLSLFYRKMTAYGQKDVISLEEELDLLGSYLFIQNKRYGNAFKVKIDIPSDIQRNTFIPPLVLQLLAENAVKHNIISFDSPLELSIYVNDLFLVIDNTIMLKSDKEESEGVGLKNIQNRYRLFAKKDIFFQEIGNHFIVRLPLIKMV